MESPVFTKKEVADFLKVSVPTVVKWTKDNKLTQIRFGGSIRFNKEEVIEFNNQRNTKLNDEIML
jgi:excisionase family DNA binding protein